MSLLPLVQLRTKFTPVRDPCPKGDSAKRRHALTVTVSLASRGLASPAAARATVGGRPRRPVSWPPPPPGGPGWDREVLVFTVRVCSGRLTPPRWKGAGGPGGR